VQVIGRRFSDSALGLCAVEKLFVFRSDCARRALPAIRRSKGSIAVP
jgi:hypothetical protein